MLNLSLSVTFIHIQNSLANEEVFEEFLVNFIRVNHNNLLDSFQNSDSELEKSMGLNSIREPASDVDNAP